MHWRQFEAYKCTHLIIERRESRSIQSPHLWGNWLGNTCNLLFWKVCTAKTGEIFLWLLHSFCCWQSFGCSSVSLYVYAHLVLIYLLYSILIIGLSKNCLFVCYWMKAELPFFYTIIGMDVELTVLCSTSNQSLLEVVWMVRNYVTRNLRALKRESKLKSD